MFKMIKIKFPIHYSDSAGITIDLTDLDSQYTMDTVNVNECFGKLMTGTDMDETDICTDPVLNALKTQMLLFQKNGIPISTL